MRPEVELLVGDPADGSASSAFFGRRWALALGSVLLAGFALITAARWLEALSSPAGPETVIQQPVPADGFPSATRSDTTAPDPGDSPPP